MKLIHIIISWILQFKEIMPKLLMVIELFRHGDREPLFDYYNAKDFHQW